MPQMSPLVWEILFIMSTIGALTTASKNYFYLESSVKMNKTLNFKGVEQNNWTW
uniref:ATP synthase F0 subunit 8 n=1 Tax=Dicyrtomina saundersi TaxID=438492 RepID=A0A516EZU1_9HEXA|nr:ATP synthase F0 subunit 8 [Dicyrtomina saundersi]QDO72012.1 ATP synthase F0 subunit 8 [Dicyrtomina saundersi]